MTSFGMHVALEVERSSKDGGSNSVFHRSLSVLVSFDINLNALGA